MPATLPLSGLLLLLFTPALVGCGGGSGGGFEGSLDEGNTQVNTSMPAGDHAVREPAICCVGRRVHVAWVDDRVNQGDIRFNTSTTGTSTWLQNDLRVNTDIEGEAERRSPGVCVEETTVHVIWTDFRDTGPQIRYNRSLDSGRTFETLDKRVSVNLPLTSTNRDPRMCCDGDRLYVVWSQDETGAVYFNRSFNAGGVWIAVPVRLNPIGTVGSHPAVCCQGDQVNVTWQDNRNGALDIYTTVSFDAGATWLPQNVRVDTDTPGLAASVQPRICCSNSRVYIAWIDSRNQGEAVYTNFSSNRGVDYQRLDLRMDTAAILPTAVESHAIQCVNQYVHLAWADNRDGETDVFYRRSVNSGLSWEPTDFRIDDGPAGATASTSVSLCANIPHVYLTWTEASGADTSDLWFAYSLNNGESGAAPPQKVNDTPPMSTTATAGVICCDLDDVYGAWVDTRNVTADPAAGRADIYSQGSQ